MVCGCSLLYLRVWQAKNAIDTFTLQYTVVVVVDAVDDDWGW